MSRQVTYTSLMMTSNPSLGSKVDDDKENQEVDEKDLKGEDDTTCGWFGFRPGCMQWCNRAPCFLVFWSAFALFQSSTVNGLVYVAITTLERRFSLPSTQSGAISSSFDFTVLTLIVFVTYLTERLHKPLLIGFGAIVFGLGSYVFTLPHFLSPKYSPRSVEEIEVCHVNGTADGKCGAESNGGLSGFYWYFIAGQVLHGIGTCPIYAHGRTFIYENVRTNLVPVYYAISQLLSSLGIAVGYVLGGVLLQLYTDLSVDVNTLGFNPDSNLWIGNWWIGFLIFGTCNLLVSIPLTSFPRTLRGTSAIRKANDEQTRPQKGSEFYSTRGLKGLIKDFPRAMWNLIKNIPLMCINFGVAAEFAVIVCTTVFGPKFVETQFNLQPGTAALTTGAVIVPASIIGVLLGGWIVKKFHLQYRGQARFCLLSLSASLLLLTAFFIRCPNVDFAGVTSTYPLNHRAFDDSTMNITDPCNSRCQCGDSYSPVCGTYDVMYYSACHAGCSSLEYVNGTKIYVGCSCIPSASSGGYEGGAGMAIPGRCTTDCNRIYFFFLMIFFLVICTSLSLVPYQTMLLGIVSPSQRTTAMGLHSLILRSFGSVPGPIIFGRIIDGVCLIWEYDCDGAKTCWMYQNDKLSLWAFVILVICRSLSLLFFTAALLLYKPSENPSDEKIEN